MERMEFKDGKWDIPVIDFKREVYEMDAIEAKQAELFNNRMIAQGYEQCAKCAHWKHEDELYNNLCDDCIKEIIDDTTLEEVMEYASTLDEKDELALYTDYLFDTRGVIEMLQKAARELEAISKNILKGHIIDFIANDTGHYIDYLDKKGDL